jgi:hypothetical protein
MNAIILKGAALRQPPLPQSDPRAKTISHPCTTQIGSRGTAAAYRLGDLEVGVRVPVG